MDLDTFYKTCQTGDILLFSTNHWYSKIIEYFTDSIYSHIGIILKNPTYIDSSLTGLYLFESGFENEPSPEDGKYKFGVQISKLEDVIDKYKNTNLGKLFYRKVNCKRDKSFIKSIQDIHSITYDKPYDFDIFDWIKAAFDIHTGDEQKTNTYWCSALVAFSFYKLRLLNKLDWTIIKPGQFGYKDNTLEFINCSLENEIKLNLD